MEQMVPIKYYLQTSNRSAETFHEKAKCDNDRGQTKIEDIEGKGEILENRRRVRKPPLGTLTLVLAVSTTALTSCCQTFQVLRHID